jgi:hypothetical protein
MAPYHHPSLYFVKAEEGLPAYSYDANINPITRVDGAREMYAKYVRSRGGRGGGG